MSGPWLRREGDTLILALRVAPRAGRDQVVGTEGSRLKIRIGAPPADGEANERLLRFLARAFRVPKSRVTLLSGAQAREKRVAVCAPRAHPEWLGEP